jgi:YidC/Oxa1 family membrane protein insertase
MSATMDKTQRTMFLILPLTFIFFLLNFPVGLVIYWVTTNLWTVGQGLVTRRMMPKAQPPPKRSSRTPPKEQAAQDGAAAPEPEPEPAVAQAAVPAEPKRVKRKKKKGGARR